ncbi:hypothetical protein [Oceaniferula marina]|nr:hypothetical protein [Oceaniferula marina]
MVCFFSACQSEQQPQAENQEVGVVQESDVTLALRVSETRIQTSQGLEVNLQARHRQGVQLIFPEWGHRWGTFDVLEHHTSLPHLDEHGWIQQDVSLTLFPDAPGKQTVEALPVEVIQSDGRRRSIHTESISVEVVSVLHEPGSEPKLQDIVEESRPEYRLSTGRMLVYLIALALFVLVCLGIGIFLYRKFFRGGDRSSNARQLPDSRFLLTQDPEEALMNLEPILSRELSAVYHWKLCSNDFHHLSEHLDVSKPIHAELQQLISKYNSYQYAGARSQGDAEQLCRSFFFWIEQVIQESSNGVMVEGKGDMQ